MLMVYLVHVADLPHHENDSTEPQPWAGLWGQAAETKGSLKKLLQNTNSENSFTGRAHEAISACREVWLAEYSQRG